MKHLMEFFEVEFDDSLLGGNWLTGVRTTPKKCKQYIQNNVHTSVGKKGLQYAVKEGIQVNSMGNGMNNW